MSWWLGLPSHPDLTSGFDLVVVTRNNTRFINAVDYPDNIPNVHCQ